jgi:two-component system sensor histidine kinase PilS (NtrC family)
LDFQAKSSQKRRFIFLNSIRLSILSALIVFSVLISLLFKLPFPASPIIISLVLAVIFSLLNFLFIRVLKQKLAFYIQLLQDIIVVTLLVYFSGGVQSPFYFLYILPIIVGSFFLSKRETIYIATLSYMIFGILSSLIYLEFIPLYKGVSLPTITRGQFTYNLLMSFLAFSTIALISSYYFERMRKTGAELKNIQENLKDLILLNNAVFNKMENGFITCDTQGNIISFNDKAKSMLNFRSNSNLFKLLFAKGTQSEMEQLGKSEKRLYLEQELDGLTLGISASIIKNIYAFDKLYIFIITDLTEIRRIEKELKQKEHLALIGEMAAGLAHEIRNPLASISGSVQFLKNELKLSTENNKLMNIIVTESDRLSKSIEEFLGFSKVTPLKKSRFDLSSVIDDVVGLISTNRDSVTFIKKYNRGNYLVADKKRINQLVWNLINNSVKAVGGKGEIELNIYHKNGTMNLAVKDNGMGIVKSDLEKIFIPFFSKFSSGIGLGMAIVKQIIEEHSFDLKINSKRNVGTEVVICFTKK